MNTEKRADALVSDSDDDDQSDAREDAELPPSSRETKPENEEPSDYEDDYSRDDALRDKADGNKMYSEGRWQEAVTLYTTSLRSRQVPAEERAVFYSNRAAARLKTEDWKGVVRDCSKALRLNANPDKALGRRKAAYEALEDYAKALDDAKALANSGKLDVNEVARLTKLKTEKEEKQKNEAIQQLKEVGNSFLSMFGMSVDNFKMEKDENSGGYSIRYNQNG